jgi:aminoglycoside phosphotransferase (APT) family kinase protein
VDEIELAGGGINTVVRIGDTVRRPVSPWTPATQELIEVLYAAGLPVPRWHGIDDEGREILDYLPGEMGHYPLSEAVRSEAALVSAARLLRRFHDASVPLVSRDLSWQLPPLPDAEVIVHGDYAPYNLVFTQDQVTGIIDLDYARPGPRSYDIAYAIYRFAPLTVADEGWGSLTERTARVRMFCDEYGLDASQRVESVQAVVTRMRGMVTYMREEAAAGNEAFARHIAEGHDALYERDADYVLDHLAEFAI